MCQGLKWHILKKVCWEHFWKLFILELSLCGSNLTNFQSGKTWFCWQTKMLGLNCTWIVLETGTLNCTWDCHTYLFLCWHLCSFSGLSRKKFYKMTKTVTILLKNNNRLDIIKQMLRTKILAKILTIKPEEVYGVEGKTY